MIKKLGPKGGKPLKDIQSEMVEKLASIGWPFDAISIGREGK